MGWDNLEYLKAGLVISMQELYIQDIIYTMGWDNLKFIIVGLVVSMQELYIQDIIYTMGWNNLEYLRVRIWLYPCVYLSYS